MHISWQVKCENDALRVEKDKIKEDMIKIDQVHKIGYTYFSFVIVFRVNLRIIIM